MTHTRQQIDQMSLILRCKMQDETIKILVQLVDQLRQPFNNSSQHEDLYWLATNTLNRLEGMDKI